MATKTVKKATNNKVELKDSLNKIKSTAKKVNNQIVDTAGDVVEDLMSNGEQLRGVAVKQVKKAIEKINLKDGVSFVKETAKSVNSYTLETAEELVDGALVNGEKWQGVATKAVNGSLKLAAKQQDIMFTTLETVKKQLTKSSTRFIGLFKNN